MGKLQRPQGGKTTKDDGPLGLLQKRAGRWQSTPRKYQRVVQKTIMFPKETMMLRFMNVVVKTKLGWSTACCTQRTMGKV